MIILSQLIFGRPYKTRVCNVQEYDSRPQELYKDYTWMKERGASRLKRERTTRFFGYRRYKHPDSRACLSSRQ